MEPRTLPVSTNARFVLAPVRLRRNALVKDKRVLDWFHGREYAGYYCLVIGLKSVIEYSTFEDVATTSEFLTLFSSPLPIFCEPFESFS